MNESHLTRGIKEDAETETSKEEYAPATSAAYLHGRVQEMVKSSGAPNTYAGASGPAKRAYKPRLRLDKVAFNLSWPFSSISPFKPSRVLQNQVLVPAEKALARADSILSNQASAFLETTHRSKMDTFGRGPEGAGQISV